MKGLDSRPFGATRRLLLFLQDRPGMMGGPGEEQHQVRLEFAQQPGIKIHGLHFRKTIGAKSNEIQTTECSRKFVLPADVPSQYITSDVERTFCEIIFLNRTI
jgi:hypothetical protein